MPHCSRPLQPADGYSDGYRDPEGHLAVQLDAGTKFGDIEAPATEVDSATLGI